MRRVINIVLNTLCIFYIIPYLVLQIVRLLFGNISVEANLLCNTLMSYILIIIWTTYLKMKNSIKFNELPLIYLSRFKLILFGSGLVGIGYSMALSILYFCPFFDVVIPNGFTYESYQRFYSSFIMLCLTVIIIPVIEELLFRGVIQNLFIKYIGLQKGLILTAIFFGILHGKSMLFIFLVFYFTGWLYFKTKNIIYAICVHICINLTNVTLGLLGLLDNKIYAIYLCLLGIILLFIGLIICLIDKELKYK